LSPSPASIRAANAVAGRTNAGRRSGTGTTIPFTGARWTLTAKSRYTLALAHRASNTADRYAADITLSTCCCGCSSICSNIANAKARFTSDATRVAHGDTSFAGRANLTRSAFHACNAKSR
jgi:hypothetical protein